MKTRILLGSIFITLGLAAAHAQSTWNGTTSNDWATASNWAPAIPAAGDNVIIATTTTNGLTLDTSHAIGSFQFGTTGTRTANFTLNTQAANALTIAGGVIANGGFSTSQALTLRGHYVVSADQSWSVAGSAAHSTDQGVVVREITTGATNRGSLTLNANLTKTGVGQLDFIAIDVSGNGNLVIDSGDLKLNAGGSQPLVVGGSGNLTMNGSSVLAVYKNSGTMNITRSIVMNDTSSLVARNSTVDIASPIAFNGTHTLDAGGTTNLAGAWTGIGTVNRTGTGTLTLRGDKLLFTGTLNNAGGTTNLTDAGGFGGGGGVAAHGAEPAVGVDAVVGVDIAAALQADGRAHQLPVFQHAAEVDGGRPRRIGRVGQRAHAVAADVDQPAQGGDVGGGIIGLRDRVEVVE